MHAGMNGPLGRYLVGSNEFWEVVWQAGVNAVHALGVKGPVGCVEEPCSTGIPTLQVPGRLNLLHECYHDIHCRPILCMQVRFCAICHTMRHLPHLRILETGESS